MTSQQEKSNLLAVSIVVKNDSGNILLRQREKDPDKGKWELFASYPYLDELPLEKAAERILREKAGISKVRSLEFSGKFYDRPGRHPGSACVPLVFIAKVSGDTETLDTTQWFSPEELKELPVALDNKTTLIDLGLL